MRRTEKQTLAALNNACAIIGEHFNDYLVIGIKKGTQDRYWRASNPTWGVGAAQRYINHVASIDHMDLEKYGD